MSTHAKGTMPRKIRITHFIDTFALFEKCRPRREAVANNVNVWTIKLEKADPYPKDLRQIDTVRETERRECLSFSNLPMREHEITKPHLRYVRF